MCKKQNAFSIIEMTLALFLSSLLLLSLFKVYLISKDDLRWVAGITSVYRRGDMALVMLNKIVSQAGLDDCSAPEIKINNKKLISGRVKNKNDELTVGLCRKVKGKRRFVSTSIYIDKTSYKNAQGQSVRALFIKSKGGRRLELIRDVSGFTIDYGIAKQNKIVSNYRRVADVGDWLSVNDVKINVLVNSENAFLKKPMGYVFNGKQLLAHDKKYYRVFSEVIPLMEG